MELPSRVRSHLYLLQQKVPHRSLRGAVFTGDWTLFRLLGGRARGDGLKGGNGERGQGGEDGE